MDINFKNDAFAFVGIKSTDPEIVGTESMDLNLEIPMGEITSKVALKITSTVASSIMAQERLNQIARDNINFIGAKISDGIHHVMDNANYWANKIHEIEMLQKQWRQEERMAD